MSTGLKIDIDCEGQTVTIEGVCYAFSFFTELGQHGIPLNQSFKVANRDEQCLTIERIDEQAIRADERRVVAKRFTVGDAGGDYDREVTGFGEVCEWTGCKQDRRNCPNCPIRKAVTDGK